MKWIYKWFLWPHSPQVVAVLCCIPSLVAWMRGKATSLEGFLIGWNLAGVFMWQLYLWQAERTEWWRKQAFKNIRSGIDSQKDTEELFELLEKHIESKSINPNRN